MASQGTTFSPSGSYIQGVKESSRIARERAGIVIDDDAIKALLTSHYFTETYEKYSTQHGMAMPLKFPSVLSEVNLLSVLSLLNFGSGYRIPLHNATGRGAFDNIRALVLGMYISSSTGTGEGNYLSAQGMRDIKEHTIADLMGVTNALHVEKKHATIPAVTVGELGGPIWELVKLITSVMNETGEVLLDTGYPDLGSLVLEAFREGEKAKRAGKGPNADCNVILERLVNAIPAFRDMAQIQEQSVYCFKKALLTIHAIALRFNSSGTSSTELSIPDTSQLPIFVDNVIPSVLVHIGVIHLSQSSTSLGLRDLFPDSRDNEKIHTLLDQLKEVPAEEAEAGTKKKKDVPPEGPILSATQAYIIRAAAIDACERIVQLAEESGRKTSAPEIDAWLWSAAKGRPDWRKLERFVQRDTVYF